MKLLILQPTIRWQRITLIALTIAAVAVTALLLSLKRARHDRRILEAKHILEDLVLIDGSDSPIDLTTSRSNICEIHGVEMSVGTVPVIYGLLERPLRSTLAERAAPHAYWTAAGGCIVRSSSPDARAYICPECVRQATDMTYSYSQPEPFLPRLDFPRLK